jgi:hypothetical protein
MPPGCTTRGRRLGMPFSPWGPTQREGAGRAGIGQGGTRREVGISRRSTALWVAIADARTSIDRPLPAFRSPGIHLDPTGFSARRFKSEHLARLKGVGTPAKPSAGGEGLVQRR